MKKVTSSILATLAVSTFSFGGGDIAPAEPVVETLAVASAFKVYIGAELDIARVKLDSGGYNISGDFPNTNDDIKLNSLPNIKIGLDFMNDYRMDVSYRQYSSKTYVTDSFAPPTPTFFYDNDVKVSTTMINLYRNFYKADVFTLYAGGGIGMAKTKIATDDTVVNGAASKNNFAWQLEVGSDYNINESMVLNFGYRYADLGKTTVLLDSGTSGDFTADMTSNELFIGLRYLF